MTSNTPGTAITALPTSFIFELENQRHPIRTVRDADGLTWFVAQDICRALDLTNTSRALSRLDPDEKGVHSINTLGGQQDLTTVNEWGLNCLILRSIKPQAKVFKRWLTHDVIPAIRRDGVYVRGEELLLTSATPEQLRTQLLELEAVAAKGLVAKATRGMDALEEREARSDGLTLVNRGRKHRRGPRIRFSPGAL